MTKELAPIRNDLGDEVAAAVSSLPPGLYRSTMTICRIEVGPDGLEKSSTVVLYHCVDFTAAPPALPPAGGES